MFKSVKEFFYPGIESIKISPLDGTLMFYDRVASLCPPTATVLDYGAGSGESLTNMPTSKQNLMLFKPYTITRIGVDVDEKVLQNQYLDKSYLLNENNNFKIPIEDNTIDLVVSDWVIEHLPFPEESFEDIYRVLKRAVGFVQEQQIFITIHMPLPTL